MAITKLIADSITSGAIANTPAFHAYLSANQNINSNVNTKVQCNTEIYDTDNCYDNSTNYRFTPTTAGKYYVYANLSGQQDAYVLYYNMPMIYKNGSEYSRNVIDPNNNSAGKHNLVTPSIGMIIDFNTTDYVEIYAIADVGAGTPNVTGDSSASQTFFGGYKLIGA